MSLTELLLKARSQKAEELLFVVGSEPKIYLNNTWQALRESPALMTEWKLLQQSLLNSQQIAILETKGVVQGETALNSARIGFSFYQSDMTMKAVLDMNLDGSQSDFQLPPSLIETCKMQKGLVILSGPGESGQVWALHKLLQTMNDESAFVGVVFSKKAFPQIKEAKSTLLYHSGVFASEMEREALMAGVNVVVYEGDSGEQSFAEAVSLAEQGVFVIYSMKAPSVGNALRRCLIALGVTGIHGASRFAEVLAMVAGQYPFMGLSGDKLFAHEVLLMKPQIRKMLQQQDINSIEEALNTSPENTGILSLNQSLLQHLIRRRIDLKTSFEVSRDPDALDSLLKKVGI